MIHCMRKKELLFLSCISLMLSVNAQQPVAGTDSSITSMNEVVLTALRSKQENLRIPYTVSAVSGKFLQEFSPRSTPEALMGLPGVFVQKQIMVAALPLSGG